MPNHMRVVQIELDNLWKLPNMVPGMEYVSELVTFTPHPVTPKFRDLPVACIPTAFAYTTRHVLTCIILTEETSCPYSFSTRTLSDSSQAVPETSLVPSIHLWNE